MRSCLTLMGAICASASVFGISTSAKAALTVYESRSDFETAIAGFINTTVDFDSASFGQTIPSGSTFDGITFTYSLTDLGGDPLAMVVDDLYREKLPRRLPRGGAFVWV